MKLTLLILAAGMGSRFGGAKQLSEFGPNGETILDYSLYDAIQCNFSKVIFVIRKELEQDFERIFGPKLKGKIDYEFVIQTTDKYLPCHLKGIIRQTPWGTGHAILCAREYITTPFVVINADDFYGTRAFEIMFKFFKTNKDENCHSMVAYQLDKTLSENGSVSRGMCCASNGFLEAVVEKTKINKNEKIYNDQTEELDGNSLVSMNFWGFMPSIFPEIERLFSEHVNDSRTSEFYITSIITNLLNSSKCKCKVFKSPDEWFGVTYPGDAVTVQTSIIKLIQDGKYPERLFE
jgi:dTDP-glucose pyrophosphorylase